MLGRIWLLLAFRRGGRLAWRLMKDRRVPLTPKLVVPAAVSYVLFPLDLMPDFFLALGQIDDLTVLVASVALFVRLCPREVVREHLESMAGRPPRQEPPPPGKVIDGDYEVLE